LEGGACLRVAVQEAVLLEHELPPPIEEPASPADAVASAMEHHRGTSRESWNGDSCASPGGGTSSSSREINCSGII